MKITRPILSLYSTKIEFTCKSKFYKYISMPMYMLQLNFTLKFQYKLDFFLFPLEFQSKWFSLEFQCKPFTKQNIPIYTGLFQDTLKYSGLLWDILILVYTGLFWKNLVQIGISQKKLKSLKLFIFIFILLIHQQVRLEAPILKLNKIIVKGLKYTAFIKKYH